METSSLNDQMVFAAESIASIEAHLASKPSAQALREAMADGFAALANLKDLISVFPSSVVHRSVFRAAIALEGIVRRKLITKASSSIEMDAAQELVALACGDLKIAFCRLKDAMMKAGL